MVGLSPLLLFHAFTNWDLLAIALSAAGLLAWARRRPVIAGALLGLAIAAKFYPLLLLGALFLLCLRAGQLRAWGRAAGAAVIAWAVVDVPIAVLAPDNWAWFFVFSRQRGANPESIWNMAQHAAGGTLFDGPLADGQVPDVLNAVVTVSLLVLVAGVAWLTLTAPVRPRVAQIAFLLVAGFLLLNKVWSPQFSLWLLPLAVLARPRWRSLLLGRPPRSWSGSSRCCTTSARRTGVSGSSGSSSGSGCATSPSSCSWDSSCVTSCARTRTSSGRRGRASTTPPEASWTTLKTLSSSGRHRGQEPSPC